MIFGTLSFSVFKLTPEAAAIALLFVYGRGSFLSSGGVAIRLAGLLSSFK